MFRKSKTALSILLFCVLIFPALTSADTASELADIQTVADWIIGLQYIDPNLPSYGAIKISNNVGHYSPPPPPQDAYFRVNPYFSNLGVAGLLRSPVSGKLEVAERWIDWYLSHQNTSGAPPGVAYDHWYLSDGTGETTCPPGIDSLHCDYADADDSYAATLLGLAWIYFEEGGSLSFLNAPGNKAKFETIAGAVLALKQSDGLTWNRPTSPKAKFTLDNCEVYWGLKAMWNLESTVFGDAVAAQTYDDAAEEVRNAIENELFNSATQLYRVAKFENDAYQDAVLNNAWYPDTVAQAWPHLFGVIEADSPRAQAQMAALNDTWDGAPQTDWTATFADPNGFPFTSIGYAALLVGDDSRAQAHTALVKAQKFPNFDSVFSVDDAGWLLNTLTQPSISISPDPMAIGDVAVGAFGTGSLTVQNTGTDTLTVTQIQSSDPAFTFSPATLTLLAGQSGTLTVTFSPTTAEEKSATLTLTHNGTGSPSTITITGTGIDSPPGAPAGLTAVAGNNQVTLNWTGNAESDLSHYVVYRSQTSDFTPAGVDSIGRVESPATAYTSTGLSAGTYYFKISAVDNAGNKSLESAQASITLAPGYSPSLSTVSFGDVQVGTSGTQTFTVSNTGSSDLTVEEITISGTDASEFTASPTGFTIDTGGSPQSVTVTFAPASAGSKAAALSIVHNATGSPSAVSLTGNGTAEPPPPAPLISLSAVSLTMDDTQVGSSSERTFTVGNSGDADLSITSIAVSGADGTQFTVSPTTATISPGGPLQPITATFSPASTGTKTASLTISHNASGSPSSVTLTGNGTTIPQPVLSLGIPFLGFEEVEVGSSSQKELTIRNTGTADLSITDINLTGTDADQFGFQPETLVIGSGTAQSVLVVFEPTSSGGKSAALSFTHNAEGSPISVQITGTAVEPAIPGAMPDVDAPSVFFVGSAAVGQRISAVMKVFNRGDESLTINDIVLTDPEFQFSSPSFPFVIPSQGSEDLRITFIPTSLGVGEATMTIRSDDPVDENLEVTLTGTGAGIAVEISIADIDFGQVAVGLSSTETFILTNTGTTNFVVNDVSITGGIGQFEVSSSKAFTVNAAGGTQTVELTYRPVESGLTGATLGVVFQDTTFDVGLSGTGIGPSIRVVPATPDSLVFGSVIVGETRTLDVVIINDGNVLLHVVGISASDPAYTVSADILSLDPGEIDTIEVTFSPEEVGFVSPAHVTISSNVFARPTINVITSGRGAVEEPKISVQIDTVNFGQVSIGEERSLGLPIGNVGTGPLNILDITSDAQVSVPQTSLIISPGETRSVPVTYRPQTNQARSGSIRVTTTDSTVVVPWIAQEPLVTISDLTGDFDVDGDVDFDDFLLFAGVFGSQREDPGFDPRYDLDDSGGVGFDDFFIFAANFGREES